MNKSAFGGLTLKHFIHFENEWGVAHISHRNVPEKTVNNDLGI